jgi:hypothetical protein
MSTNTRNPTNLPTRFARGGRDESEYERFCTDWYMPEPSLAAGSSESECRQATLRACDLPPTRLSVRPVRPFEFGRGTPVINEPTGSVPSPHK